MGFSFPFLIEQTFLVLGGIFMIINPLAQNPKSWLEERTYQILHDSHIVKPSNIDLEVICGHLNVDLLFCNVRSHTTQTESGRFQIFIDYNLPEREQREKIAHELGHILNHEGNQLFMSRDFIQYQENQTERFAGYLLVPFFMIEELPDFRDQAIYYIAEKFNVTLQLARKKYDQLISRQYEYRYQYIV